MLVESLNMSSKLLGGVKKPNCKLTKLQIFHILLVMPFFEIKGFSHYAGSGLSRMFSGKKDLFYEFIAQDDIDWRKILYRTARKMIDGITIRADHRKSDLPNVIIVDDTDLPKTGHAHREHRQGVLTRVPAKHFRFQGSDDGLE